MTNKLASGKKGLVVITLKQLPPDKRFVLEKTEQMKMTWSRRAPFTFIVVSKLERVTP